jgi:phage tail-like protein
VSTFESILPSHVEPLERSLEQVVTFPDLPIPALANLSDPWTTDARYLPWLAYRFAVEIWDENWSEEKRRSIIASAIRLQRIKGTLAGIREYVGAAGGELVSVRLPPGKSFLGESLTREQREAYLSRLPQIRLNINRERARTGYRAFYSDDWGKFFSDASGTKTCFPVVDTAHRRYGPRAALWDRDVLVRELTRNRTLILSAEIERIFMRGTAPAGVFGGGFPGSFFVRSAAKSRVVDIDVSRLSESERALHYYSVTPGGRPTAAVPKRVYERAIAGDGVFAGEITDGKFYTPSGALHRVYDAIHVADPSRVGAARGSISFFGDDRFGVPAFTAEISVGVPSKRPKDAVSGFVGGFWYEHRKTELDRNLRAVTAGKAARDKIMVNTSTHRPLRVGSPLFVGASLKLGNWTRS